MNHARKAVVLAGWTVALLILVPAAAAQGERLWEARYNGPANGHDGARSVATDAEGNVFVAGVSAGVGTLDDWATLKYDPDGNVLWEARLAGPANGNDLPQSLVVDANGDVYVTGFSLGAPGRQDITTAKYSGADGALLWEQREAGLVERGRVMGLDSEGNVLVAGSVGDIWVGKYRAGDGELLWSQRFDRAGGSDRPYGLAIGPADSVYVVGTSYSGSSTSIVTLKYSSDGELQWSGLGAFGGGTGAHGIAVDWEGNAFALSSVITSQPTYQFWNYRTVKYSPDGVEQWTRLYDGGSWDQARAVAVDSLGNVTVTGQSIGPPGTTYWDFATVQYDTNGDLRWVQRYHGGANDFGRSIAVDANNNVYVAGGSAVDFGVGLDIATVKYDGDGNELWVNRYDNGGTDDMADSAPAVAVSGDRVHVAGWSAGAGTFLDYLTLALSN